MSDPQQPADYQHRLLFCGLSTVKMRQSKFPPHGIWAKYFSHISIAPLCITVYQRLTLQYGGLTHCLQYQLSKLKCWGPSCSSSSPY